MLTKLTCPRCSSRRIKAIRYAAWDGPSGARVIAHWKCQGCGESSYDPAHAGAPSPTLDITMGFAVLATLATTVATALVCML